MLETTLPSQYYNTYEKLPDSLQTKALSEMIEALDNLHPNWLEHFVKESKPCLQLWGCATPVTAKIILESLKKYNSGLELKIIDSSPDAIELNKKRAVNYDIPLDSIYEESILNLPNEEKNLGQNSADIIATDYVLLFLGENIQEFFSRAHAQLSQNGVLVTTNLNDIPLEKRSFSQKIFYGFYKNIVSSEHFWDIKNIITYTPPEIVRQAALNAGFERVEIKISDKFPTKGVAYQVICYKQHPDKDLIQKNTFAIGRLKSEVPTRVLAIPEKTSREVSLQERSMCGVYCVDYLCKAYNKPSPLETLLFKQNIVKQITTPFLAFSPWSEFGVGARLLEAGFNNIEYKYFNRDGSLEKVKESVNSGKKIMMLLFRNHSSEWISNTPEVRGPHWVIVEGIYGEGKDEDLFYQIYDPNQGKVLISEKSIKDYISPKPTEISPTQLLRKFNGYFVL